MNETSDMEIGEPMYDRKRIYDLLKILSLR